MRSASGPTRTRSWPRARGITDARLRVWPRGAGSARDLPPRPLGAGPTRRDRSEGAELVVVDGTYEDAVAQAAEAAAEPGVLEVADVGTSGTAHWVIDGYATLFDEAQAQAAFDLIVCLPASVRSPPPRHGTAPTTARRSSQSSPPTPPA